MPHMVNPTGVDLALRRPRTERWRTRTRARPSPVPSSLPTTFAVWPWPPTLHVSRGSHAFTPSQIYVRLTLTWCESHGLDPLAAAQPHIRDSLSAGFRR